MYKLQSENELSINLKNKEKESESYESDILKRKTRQRNAILIIYLIMALYLD